MIFLQALVLGILVLSATGVALTRDPFAQTIGLSFYGTVLGILFFLFQAPDVALSQITVGAVALPMMSLLALARMKKDKDEKKAGNPKDSRRKAS